jgi:hypothetical protein
MFEPRFQRHSCVAGEQRIVIQHAVPHQSAVGGGGRVRGRGAFQYAAQAAHGGAVGDDAGAVGLDGPATHRAHRLPRPFRNRHTRHLAALSVTTTNAIVAIGQHSRRPNQRLRRASQPVGRHSFRAQAVLHDPYLHALLRFAVGVPRRGRVAQVVGCVGRSRTARPWFGGWLLLRGRLQCTRRRAGTWNRDRVVCSLFGQVDRKAVRGEDGFARCGAEVAVLAEGAEWRCCSCCHLDCSSRPPDRDG